MNNNKLKAISSPSVQIQSEKTEADIKTREIQACDNMSHENSLGRIGNVVAIPTAVIKSHPPIKNKLYTLQTSSTNPCQNRNRPSNRRRRRQLQPLEAHDPYRGIDS